MKKINNNYQFSKNSLKSFLSKNSSFVVLGMCILVVGASAIFVSTQNPGGFGNNIFIGDEEDLSSDSSSITGQIDSSANADQASSALGTATPAPSSDPSKVSQKPSEGSPQNTKSPSGSTMPTFSAPLTGQIITSHSANAPLYSTTFGDWRIHKGVDISAEIGTPVKAAAGGTVEDINSNSGMGVTIVVDHGDSYKTVYSNLGEYTNVTIGDKVESGKVLATVGNSASFESQDPPHLHFDILKGNESLNPIELIKDIQP